MKSTSSGLVSGLFVVALLMMGTAPGPRAEEVAVGASREEVLRNLGAPNGTTTVGRIEFLQYPRGIVELLGGSVVSSTVLSEEEYQRSLEKKRKQDELRKQRAEERRWELYRLGTAEKEKVLADGSVAKLTPAGQVAYWESFVKQYPGVIVSAELADAREKLAAEKLAAENKRKQELAEAEADQGPPPGLSSRRLRKYLRGRHGTTETE